MNFFIFAFTLNHLRRIEHNSFVRVLETTSNNKLHYLQNISAYMIIEFKMHCFSLKNYKI